MSNAGILDGGFVHFDAKLQRRQRRKGGQGGLVTPFIQLASFGAVRYEETVVESKPGGVFRCASHMVRGSTEYQVLAYGGLVNSVSAVGPNSGEFGYGFVVAV